MLTYDRSSAWYFAKRLAAHETREYVLGGLATWMIPECVKEEDNDGRVNTNRCSHGA